MGYTIDESTKSIDASEKPHDPYDFSFLAEVNKILHPFAGRTPGEIAYEEMSCNHAVRKLIFVVCSNGVKQYKMQCTGCGTKSEPIKYSKLSASQKANAEPDDVEIRERWTTKFRARLDELRPLYAEEKHRLWWAKYHAHIESGEWKDTRLKALERDDWKCRQCGQPAEHVHHNTYDRLGNEALDDLESLCFDCHAGIHPHMIDEDEKSDIPNFDLF